MPTTTTTTTETPTPETPITICERTIDSLTNEGRSYLALAREMDNVSQAGALAQAAADKLKQAATLAELRINLMALAKKETGK